MTVVAVAGDLPMIYLVLLLVASTMGAICGDNISYGIGTKIPIERLRIFRAGRGERALKKIRRQMARRGTLLIMTGRFIPGGRVAVNMTSGAVAYPWRASSSSTRSRLSSGPPTSWGWGSPRRTSSPTTRCSR